MKRGATDFLTKPVNLDKLEILIKRALQSKSLESENQQLHQRLDGKFNFEGIMGGSSALDSVRERISLVAPSKATVLIEGETGSGKELIAQAIHQNSGRSKRPFVAVHCAALPETLLESELFGHEKGAFTGATERRIGRFEAADSGTLFLDEIGEISLSIQVKLLRFLEQKTFERIGSSTEQKVDVRLVAATNRNLAEMVKEGTFREDLYFRLNVVQINMPPLRDHAEDIPILLNHFLEESGEENALPVPSFEPGAMRAVMRYPWPGNVRELRNFAENVVVLHRGSRIQEFDLDSKFRTESGGEVNADVLSVSPLSVEENSKRLLREALIEAGGNRTKAAKLMGISRRTLHRKLSQWPELDVSGLKE
jgi:DNA-binding NtrC family response regulator